MIDPQKKKTRTSRFFIEMIVATILSLVSASLWADFVRGVLATHFKNDSTVVFATAAGMTIAAIFVLRYLFADIPKNEEGYLR